MARIRSVHPGLFTDEAFMQLTIECPLAVPFLLGLWAEADDSGTFEWKPLTLKARILPGPNCNILELLEALIQLRFIRRFEIDGRAVGVVRNFARFQRPQKPDDKYPFNAETRAYAGFIDGSRPNAKTRAPSIDDGSGPVPNQYGTGPVLSPQREEEGGRVESKEISSLRSEGEPARDPGSEAKPAKQKPTRLDRAWEPDASDWTLACEAIGLDAAILALAKFRDHWTAKPKDAEKLDWAATWRNWVREDAEKCARARAGPRAAQEFPTKFEALAAVKKRLPNGKNANNAAWASPDFRGPTIEGNAREVRQLPGIP